MSEPIKDMRDYWRIYYPYYKTGKDGYPTFEIDEEWIKNNPQPLPLFNCLSCGVIALLKDFKHRDKCKATISKGCEYMTEEQAINYRPLSLFSSKPWKKGGWRKLTEEEKKNERI